MDTQFVPTYTDTVFSLIKPHVALFFNEID